MNILQGNHSNITKAIEKNQVHTIRPNRSGKEITCLYGTIWITQKGDRIDRILKCGDIYQSRIGENILVQGLDDSRIRVSAMNKVEVIEHYNPVVGPKLACA